MKKNIYAISGNNKALSGFFRAHKPTTGNFKDAGYFTNGMTWHDLSRGMRNANLNLHLDVSEKRGFSPQIIHFNSVFHYRPSTLGYPYFWKHPFVFVCVCVYHGFFWVGKIWVAVPSTKNCWISSGWNKFPLHWIIHSSSHNHGMWFSEQCVYLQ